MNSNPSVTPPAAEERLAAALEEYQTALELGLPLDRTSFLVRFADLPDLAADLDALDILHESSDEPTVPQPAEPTLADFEIVREAGRGGMGIVYEARQVSLNRRVAVKVLTQAAALDDRTRKRFLHEARAAALVHHPNVVPVYHVGEEQGVPFYVMPFIPGTSLAVAIQARRKAEGRTTPADPLPPAGTPGYFQAVAGVGRQAAAALAEAHAQGVVHRDVKPANLLLDPTGKVWVTDFGLALAPFTDGLTRTGTRPGTPRYMSPEQLNGPRQKVDARTDVYSLGVTLYELATLRPAFEAEDEPELIRRIVQAERLTPRKVNDSIPADLETVILKAMARDPDDRYAAAADLAADLNRFIEHRPILARRPGVVRHARKWLRRNRRPVAVIAATLLVGLLAGLSVSVIRNRRAYEAERSARAEADANRRLAIAAVTELGSASDDILSHAPGMQDRQLAFLLKSQETLEPFARDESLPVSLRREIAWVHYRLALCYYRAGRLAESEAAARMLVERLTPLVELAPDDAKVRNDLAFAHRHVGYCVALQRGDSAVWHEHYRLAFEHSAAAYRLTPDRAPAIVLYHELRMSMAEIEARPDDPLSQVPVRLEALRAFEKLRDRYPTGHPLSYMRLASNWGGVGHLYENARRIDDAEAAMLTAVANDDHLTEHFAKEPADIHEYSVHFRYRLGWLRIRRGNTDGGLPELRRGVAALEMFVAKYPTLNSRRDDLAFALFALALTEELSGRRDAARAAADRCAELLTDPNLAGEIAFQARVWAFLPYRGDPAAAKVLMDRPGSVVVPWLRAVVLYRLGRYPEAEAVTDRSIPGEFVRAACLAQRGQRDAARAVLDAAAARLAAEPLRDPGFVLLQREVADLLAEK